MTRAHYVWSSHREFVGDAFIVDKNAGGWYIYEFVSERLGKVVRRYDPQAGQQKGLPASFQTKEEAVEYVKRWCMNRTT